MCAGWESGVGGVAQVCDSGSVSEALVIDLCELRPGS